MRRPPRPSRRISSGFSEMSADRQRVPSDLGGTRALPMGSPTIRRGSAGGDGSPRCVTAALAMGGVCIAAHASNGRRRSERTELPAAKSARPWLRP